MQALNVHQWLSNLNLKGFVIQIREGAVVNLRIDAYKVEITGSTCPAGLCSRRAGGPCLNGNLLYTESCPQTLNTWTHIAPELCL